jgi:hypothetical protein
MQRAWYGVLRFVRFWSNEECPDKRQLQPATESQKALAIEEIKPLLNPAAKRLKVTYGPYKIKGKDVHPSTVGRYNSD